MRALLFSLCLLLPGLPADAALHFPALTGRVVDDAHMLSQGTVQSLDQTLAGYEQGTTNQVVVVTLPSLQGTSIEDYGYQLGRTWQIGQKGKNNGVLLIVAPHERKVRIEVGYGLEGTLTDAASSEIIHGIILPKFRSGQTEQGIMEGTQAILSVLGGNTLPTHSRYNSPSNESPAQPPGQIPVWAGWLILLCVTGFFIYVSGNSRLATIGALRLGSSRLYGSGWGYGGSFGGGGFGGGGFSGGGGSFGGGGASGGW